MGECAHEKLHFSILEPLKFQKYAGNLKCGVDLEICFILATNIAFTVSMGRDLLVTLFGVDARAYIMRLSSAPHFKKAHLELLLVVKDVKMEANFEVPTILKN